MDPALVKLLKLRFRGMVRRMFRGVKTLRGGLFFAIGLAMLALWLGPNLFAAAAIEERSDPEAVRAFVPLALLGMCLLSLFGSGRQKAVYFGPAEIDFLFSGPFTRRQLLAYKLSTTATGAVFAALIFSIILWRHVTWWIAAFVGSLLAMLFVQLLSTAAALIAQTVAERAYTRARKLILYVAVALVVLGLGQAFSARAEGSFTETLVAFRHSWTGTCLLAPFDVFGRTITAGTLIPALAGWAALAAAVDVALLGLVMRLDVNYMESAIAVSQKLYGRIQRARRGGVAWAASGSTRRRPPSLPWMGGAGPIAWRQLTTALRSARGMVLLLIIMAVAMAPLFSALRKSGGLPPGLIAGQLAFLTVIFTRLIPFDFRGDLDHIGWLKSLPLSSTAVSAGQLTVPAMIMTTFHLVVLAVIAPFVHGPPLLPLAIGLFTLPFNYLLFGVENLFFLLFPARLVTATPGDFQHIGRTMVEMLVKILVLAVCGGLAAALGGLGYWASGGSWSVFVALAWLGLATIAVAAVPCVAWAYRHFDVSVDTPA